MPTPVVMPQMGESIAEGTIVRWIKKVGDRVERDEPLLEISTDKVDAEIPAPASGVLTEITAHEGETVAVNAVIGTIAPEAPSAGPAAAGAGASTATGAAETKDSPRPAKSADMQAIEAGKREAAAATTPQPDGSGDAAARPAEPAAAAPATPRANDAGPQRLSPLVRRMVEEHQIDITQVPGTGTGGRVTKNDVLQFLARSGAREAPAAPSARPQSGERVEIQPLSVMRRKIAEHMVLSKRTSAHVHSVFHVNFSRLAALRERHRAAYESRGVKLTYLAFIAKAVSDALRRHPLLNASLDGNNIVFKKDVNLGIAVAIEGGLIVPVIRNADEKNVLGLSRAIADVAERARTKQLKPDEVHGGTFTITNPGQYGAQFGMPIINQPQVAILGVGTVEKRPVVVDDAIGIRTMAYLTLGYDHRLIDGATADQFMADVKERIETFDETEV